MQKAAVITASGIGDGLIYSIVSRNLALQGYEVVIYNLPLQSLQPCFSYQKILPHPSVKQWHEECLKYDLVIVQRDFHAISKRPLPLDDARFKHVMIFCNWKMDSTKPLGINLLDYCKNQLSIPHPQLSIDLALSQTGKDEKRIALHTMSAVEEKIWPAHKFIKVAKKLKQLGFDPHILVGPSEKGAWEELCHKHHIPLPTFSSLVDLAQFLLESRLIIGNDSGVAHLGSALGLPTITLHQRPNRARFWQPAWSEGRVVTALPIIPTRRLRRKTWKALTMPFQVLLAFKQLIEP